MNPRLLRTIESALGVAQAFQASRATRASQKASQGLTSDSLQQEMLHYAPAGRGAGGLSTSNTGSKRSINNGNEECLVHQRINRPWSHI